MENLFDPLTTLIIGGLVTGATQIMKKYYPKANPLYWVACLAIIGGGLYGIIYPLIPVDIAAKMTFSFATAVSMYEVLKNFTKA